MKKLLALALILAGCGATSGGDKPVSDAGSASDAGLTTFIALDPDFQSYKDWREFTVLDDGSGIGDRHMWLNQRPPDGATEFPVGTIIVKEQKDLSVSTGIAIHAMVKRGGGFNAGGAKGWEWFELGSDPDAGVLIQWRGITPPDGGGYSSGIGGTCNQCHGAAESNDFVQTPSMKLGTF